MKLKRAISVLSVLALTVGLVSSCGQEQDTSSQIKGSEPDLAYKVSDKKLDLKFFYCYGGIVYNDQMPVFREAERLTNVHLKGTVPNSASDYNQSFNTLMASGDLDDIISATKDDIEKYAAAGAFVPLDDLIEQYAPNIKAYLNSNPDVKKSITSYDGHIYSLPRIETGDTAMGWYIRKDWLEKLNLEEPKTADEFYNVLKAFKNQDPNGNGQSDEIPYFNRAGTVRSLYALFGVRNRFYVDEATNEIKYGQYIPEYKVAVENVARWYKEGLIDAEIFTRGANARDELLGNNKGGSTHDWFTSTSAYNDKLQDKVPDIQFAAIIPPADTNGNIWEDSGRTGTGVGWAISTSNQHQEETIKYFDFWFTESGNRLYNYGIEGNEYTMADGKPTFTDEFINTDKPMTNLWWEHGINLYTGGVQDFNAEVQFMNEQAKKDMDLYINNKYIANQLPTLPFSPEERKILSDKLAAVESYVNEQEQKWITGAQDVSSTFDQYLEGCKNLGMEDVLKIYNDAYRRYLAN